MSQSESVSARCSLSPQCVSAFPWQRSAPSQTSSQATVKSFAVTEESGPAWVIAPHSGWLGKRNVFLCVCNYTLNAVSLFPFFQRKFVSLHKHGAAARPLGPTGTDWRWSRTSRPAAPLTAAGSLTTQSLQCDVSSSHQQ